MNPDVLQIVQMVKEGVLSPMELAEQGAGDPKHACSLALAVLLSGARPMMVRA